ncbi:EAL domain-containing protein [Silanimonas sp.]|jgi:diguanylate cyclase (GGDEF)-like protein|uniref:EAL domain-containing protein n=1 Tax=Silanimonas sp. TaxID=1929290 RepID=UPI0037CBB91E
MQPPGQALADAEREIDRLRMELDRRAHAMRFQEALFAISEVASSSKPTAEVMAAMHRIVGTLMYAENFFIALRDPERRTLRFVYFADSEDADGLDPDLEIPESELLGSLTVQVIQRQQALRGPSEQLAASLGMQDEAQGPESNDWLGVPMTSDGITQGAVVVQSYRPEHTYSAEDEQLLSYVAEHIATALARRQSTIELERRVQQRTEALQAEVVERERAERLQTALYRITALASRHESDDDARFYADVHSIVGELIDARNFYIALWDETTDETSFPYSVDERTPTRPSRKAGQGLTEYVLHSGEPLLASESVMRELNALGATVAGQQSASCWLGVPMMVDDAPVGVIAVQSYRADVRFTHRDLELLSFVGTHIAAAIGRRRAGVALRQAYLDLEHRVSERTRELGLANETLRQQISAREGVERQLKHQALHDSLTGLPNRQYLLDRLVASMAQHVAQPERLFAVLFLDLDRFKVINDSEGHLVGDALLREAAKRIGECVRNPDVLARLGGDEFAVLLERIRSVEDAINVAERIMQVLDQPFFIEGRELHSSASVGVAVAQPHYASAEEILRDADAAMYRAKADGRKRYALFDEDLRHLAQQRLELEREMRRAMVHHEFEPYYQPIVSIANGAVLGYEALLRWNRPDGTVRAPGAFLGLAEETGMIEEIDWRMYASAIGDLVRLTPSHAYVSVNLSPRHLLAPDFATRFLTLVRDQRAHPSRVCVEVTEGALIDRKDLARAALETLHRAGVRIMLDDFGTGYSALSYLQHFPLHGLKIDRSFATSLESGAETRGGSRPIIRAIVAMAASLELEVVSEGIETEEQRKALWTLGIRQGQGYHFGRPAPLQHWIDLGAQPAAV